METAANRYVQQVIDGESPEFSGQLAIALATQLLDGVEVVPKRRWASPTPVGWPACSPCNAAPIDMK